MDQQVIGTLVGQEARNGGWTAFAILVPGKDYPVKLSTKKAELIGQAQQMMGQVVTAGYNEQQSTNINPNNGQPYTNRYLEAIAFGQVDLVGTPTQIQPQQAMPQQQPQQVHYPQQPQPVQQQPIPVPQPVLDQREVKIHRQTATKVAVQLLGFLVPEERNLASLVRISEQLVHYYDNGVQWTTPPVQAPQPQAQQQHQFGPAPEAFPDAASTAAQQQYYGEPDPDDGIPF
jgi:hypothetical protein